MTRRRTMRLCREPGVEANAAGPVQAGERLGHLAAVAILNADEENPFPPFSAGHGLDPFPIHGTIIDTCRR